MSIALPSNEQWQTLCASDGEFMLAARHWNGGLELSIGGSSLVLGLNDGKPAATPLSEDEVIGFSGDENTWKAVLQQTPTRFHNDLMANISMGRGLSRSGDPVVFAQYFSAAARAVELLRPISDRGALMAHDSKPAGSMDAPVGHYIHLELAGHDHRIYYEQAGQGIPLLMQHTAGCHSSQCYSRDRFFRKIGLH